MQLAKTTKAYVGILDDDKKENIYKKLFADIFMFDTAAAAAVYAAASKMELYYKK